MLFSLCHQHPTTQQTFLERMELQHRLTSNHDSLFLLCFMEQWNIHKGIDKLRILLRESKTTSRQENFKNQPKLELSYTYCNNWDAEPTPKQIGPRPNQTEICFTFVSNPPVSWGSCRVLSQLDKCTAASAALNGQSEIETEPTRGVHLTFNPSHKTLLVLLYSISPARSFWVCTLSNLIGT